ncbi:PP2C family protein-serine/threonine phosphatase [Candidatus Riflebacteria bacterium]
MVFVLTISSVVISSYIFFTTDELAVVAKRASRESFFELARNEKFQIIQILERRLGIEKSNAISIRDQLLKQRNKLAKTNDLSWLPGSSSNRFFFIKSPDDLKAAITKTFPQLPSLDELKREIEILTRRTGEQIRFHLTNEELKTLMDKVNRVDFFALKRVMADMFQIQNFVKNNMGFLFLRKGLNGPLHLCSITPIIDFEAEKPAYLGHLIGIYTFIDLDFSLKEPFENPPIFQIKKEEDSGVNFLEEFKNIYYADSVMLEKKLQNLVEFYQQHNLIAQVVSLRDFFFNGHFIIHYLKEFPAKIMDIETTVQEKKEGAWYFFAFFLLITIFIAFHLGRIISGPIIQLTRIIKKYPKEKELLIPEQFENVEELSILSKSFSNLMTEIEEKNEIIERNNRRLQRRIQSAKDAQTLFLDPAPQTTFAQVTSLYLPSFEVGGDFYNFYFDKNKMVFIIGDVCGKGFPASYCTFMIQSMLEILHPLTGNPSQILTRLDRDYSDLILDKDYFKFNGHAGLFLAKYSAKERKLKASHAGFSAVPLLFKADGTWEELRVKGGRPYPVGMQVNREKKYINKQFDVPPGSILVFYTDGITDSRTSEPFGKERLKKIIAENASLSCEEIKQKIVFEISQFLTQNAQNDDICVIIAKIS